MELKTDAQKAAWEKISPMAKELFGEFVMFAKDAPHMAIRIGSAFAETRVLPWGDDDAIVVTRACMVTGVEVTADLMEYLLRKNGELLFGAFGLDDDRNIVFDYTIIASTCDKAELKACVMAVVTTADRYDDEIIARWGGQRAMDR